MIFITPLTISNHISKSAFFVYSQKRLMSAVWAINSVNTLPFPFRPLLNLLPVFLPRLLFYGYILRPDSHRLLLKFLRTILFVSHCLLLYAHSLSLRCFPYLLTILYTPLCILSTVFLKYFKKNTGCLPCIWFYSSGGYQRFLNRDFYLVINRRFTQNRIRNSVYHIACSAGLKPVAAGRQRKICKHYYPRVVCKTEVRYKGVEFVVQLP